MIELSKHIFEPLRRDEESVLYRGRTEKDSSQLLVRVLETFYTTKSLGMDMGLAISRSIIEAHHGWLWAAQIHRGERSFSLLCHASPACD